MKNRHRKRRHFRSVSAVVNPIHGDLKAAHDFREQQQARTTKRTTIQHQEKFRSVFSEAMQHLERVYPGARLPSRQEIYAAYQAISVNTALDDPLIKSVLDEAGEKVERAAKELKLPLRSGVSIGDSNAAELSAMQQRVMMTDASVVMITSSLFMLIHRASKLLALSSPITTFEGDLFSLSASLEEFQLKYSNDDALKNQWVDFFVDYASNPTTPPRGNALVLPGEQLPIIKDKLDESMLLFAISHEYAHHIAEHSLGGVASASGADEDTQHVQELEADAIGAHICIHIANSQDDLNPFLISNVGACVLLKILELFRQGTALLEGAAAPKEGMRKDHPPLEKRLRAIDVMTSHVVDEKSYETLFSYQSLYLDFLDIVWHDVVPKICVLRDEGIRPISTEPVQWLPRSGRR